MELARFCDFCGKHQNYVKIIIAGPRVHICDECVDVCSEIVASKRTATKDPTPTDKEE